MKKQITFLAALFIFLFHNQYFAQAENFRLFNVDIGVLYLNTPANKSNGFGGYLEPKFNITDNIAVGLKLEGGVAFGGFYEVATSDPSTIEISMSGHSSTMLTGDYFFLTDKIRPFAGLGFGRYVFVNQSISDSPSKSTVTQQGSTSFGFGLRGGVQFNAFRLALEYNIPFKQGVYVYQKVESNGSINQVVSTSSHNFSKNYLTVKLGWVIGGKRQ